MTELAFSDTEYRSRLERVQVRMRDQGIDVLLVTTPENNFYLTGFETTGYYMYQAALIPVSGDPVPIVRSLEETLLATGTWVADGEVYRDTDDPANFTARVIAERFGERLVIGLEERSFFLPVALYHALGKALPDATLVDASGVVESERMIKSEQEIAYIRAAARAASQGVRYGINAIPHAKDDRHIAAEVYSGLIGAGSEYPGDHPYVAVGERSGLAHATWAGQPVNAGDIVFLEVGGSVRRYAGAHMRSVSVGEPDAEVRRRAEVVAEALTAAVEAIKPGVTSATVDAACRGVIQEAGYGEHFRHRTGYSLGLAFPPGWGEGHIMDLKPDDERELQPNTVFHIVPILHEPGHHGIGMSETVLVTGSGCEVLTDVPRELFVAWPTAPVLSFPHPGIEVPAAADSELRTSRGRIKLPPPPGEDPDDEPIPPGAVQEALASAFRDQASWRRRKAEEFPDDLRNERAAEGLEAMTEWVLKLPDDDWRIQEIGEMYGASGLNILGEAGESSRVIGRFNFRNDPQPLDDETFDRFLEFELLDALEDDATWIGQEI